MAGKIPKRRMADGTWAKGQSGNPKGRPARETEREYLDAMVGEISIDDWKLVIQKALEQALKGDAKAREWLGRHLMGDPVHVHEYLLSEQRDVQIRVIFEGEAAPRLASGSDVEGLYEILESEEEEEADIPT